MDEQQQEEILAYLHEHSAEGTMHLLASAYHYLITKLTLYSLWTDVLTEAKVLEFAEEAWSAFAYPSILAYNTWLQEEIDGPPDRQELENNVAMVRADWMDRMDYFKANLMKDLLAD